MKHLRAAVVDIAILALVSSACADTIAISNGDRLSGAVVTMHEGSLILKTDYAGEVQVDWSQVQELALDEPLPVRLAGGEELELDRLPTDDTELADVAAIAPPSPPRVRWQGRLDFGYAQTSGNSDASLGTLAAFAELRKADHYGLSLLLDAAQGNSEGEETANRARIEGKYDRTAGEHRYVYYLAGIGYDKVRNLDLRTEFGAGIGRPFIEEPGNLLTAEAGLSYLLDEFSDGERKGDIRLRLGETWLRRLGPDTEIREGLSVLSAVTDPADLTSEFVLALTHRLNDRLALTTKFVNAYDSRPAAGTERADYTLTTQVGFAFGQ